MKKLTSWEEIFGEAKAYHGLSRAKFRGIDNVEIQMLLTATAMNLKRLFRKLDREAVSNAILNFRNQLQNSFFDVISRFLIRFSICWI